MAKCINLASGLEVRTHLKMKWAKAHLREEPGNCRNIQRNLFGVLFFSPTMRMQVLILIAAFCALDLCRTANGQGTQGQGDVGDAVYAYQLRGEVRILFFWLGRDNVGGGHIALSRGQNASANSWREEIEVLFGSDPERLPRKISRWGYGRETSQWLQELGYPAPRLVATEFQGIMRHSTESSLDEALATTRQSAASGQYIYDTTLSRVDPAWSSNEYRILMEGEEFNYRHPENLLAKFRECLASTPPQKHGRLVNSSGVYGAPYGFLTALSQLIRRVFEAGSKPVLTFVYNSRLYTLGVLGARRIEDSQLRSDWREAGAQKVSRVRFRCFNTVKKTRTDFELWLPSSGPLKGIPVRILHQPRWWLRLQLDLDLRESRLGSIQ